MDRRDFLRFGLGASACATCGHQACANACPNGVPIAASTRAAALCLA